MGFDESEIDELLASLDAEVGDLLEAQQDEVPEPPDEATSRRGDLWILGLDTGRWVKLQGDVQEALRGRP